MTKIIIYSHTHWDREWYWTFRQFQYRLGSVVDEIIDVLESNSDFTAFVADGQTSLISDYLEIRPENKERLLELIRSGRIVIGPWYTMPDTWLSGGEALIRNLYYGLKDCILYNTDQPKIGYVPDSFGHIEQMPQILNGFGINNYIFTRGVPNDDIGNDIEFLWVAPDKKSSVTAHILPQNYGSARMLEPITNPEGLKRQLKRLIEPYKNFSKLPTLVLGCGGTDHIRIQNDLPEILHEANRLMPDCDFRIGTIEDYIKEFDKNAPPLKEICGTIMGRHKTNDMLHGTWSSRIDNKIENFIVSTKLLSYAEPLAALISHYFIEHRQNELNIAWRLLLQNHAHDSICGCSMDSVHKDVSRRFSHIEEICDMIIDEAQTLFNARAIYDMNPCLLRISGLNGSIGCGEFIVDSLNDTPFHLEDTDGNKIPVEIIHKRKLVRHDILRVEGEYINSEKTNLYFTENHAIAYFPKAFSCSVMHYNIVEGELPAIGNAHAYSRTLENEYIKVTVNDNCSINVLDKKQNIVYNNLLLLMDDGEAGGGYEHHSVPYPIISGGKNLKV